MSMKVPHSEPASPQHLGILGNFATGWRSSATFSRLYSYLSVGTIEWIPLVFPLWVLLISLYIRIVMGSLS
jgi:hypothetical protein